MNFTLKKTGGRFRCVTIGWVDAVAKPANDLQLEGDGLQMTCNSPAIGMPMNNKQGGLPWVL